MNSGQRERKSKQIIVWVVAIAITLAAFYAMDHFIMGMQGLALNWDLTPAQ